MKIVIKPSKAAAWQMNTQLSIQLKLLSPMWKPSSLIYLLIKRVATFCTCEIQRGFWAKTQGCIAHQEQHCGHLVPSGTSPPPRKPPQHHSCALGKHSKEVHVPGSGVHNRKICNALCLTAPSCCPITFTKFSTDVLLLLLSIPFCSSFPPLTDLTGTDPCCPRSVLCPASGPWPFSWSMCKKHLSSFLYCPSSWLRAKSLGDAECKM